MMCSLCFPFVFQSQTTAPGGQAGPKGLKNEQIFAKEVLLFPKTASLKNIQGISTSVEKSAMLRIL